MLPATDIFDSMAHDILDTIVAALGADAPGWQAVTPSRVVHELCAEDQVSVWFVGCRASGPLTQTNARTQTQQVVTVADFGASVVRCVATPVQGQVAPTVAKIQADALRLAKDARLMWFGITQAVKARELITDCQEVTYSGLTISEPAGGKAAATMLLTVQLP